MGDGEERDKRKPDGAPDARLCVIRSALEQTQGSRQSGRVAFTEAPGDSSEREIPERADFAKSVRGK
eukprot:1665975-Alexandrium_andersonii.AAC.1